MSNNTKLAARLRGINGTLSAEDWRLISTAADALQRSEPTIVPLEVSSAIRLLRLGCPRGLEQPLITVIDHIYPKAAVRSSNDEA